MESKIVVASPARADAESATLAGLVSQWDKAYTTSVANAAATETPRGVMDINNVYKARVAIRLGVLLASDATQGAPNQAAACKAVKSAKSTFRPYFRAGQSLLKANLAHQNGVPTSQEIGIVRGAIAEANVRGDETRPGKVAPVPVVPRVVPPVPSVPAEVLPDKKATVIARTVVGKTVASIPLPRRGGRSNSEYNWDESATLARESGLPVLAANHVRESRIKSVRQYDRPPFVCSDGRIKVHMRNSILEKDGERYGDVYFTWQDSGTVRR
ncbi:hypothetical protein [Pseudarthrobacter sulfonivorans]|uniref:hypothetical protein n=1 Tax=Pseudarthrobacter sulfonivorans TaxID=121292 RepID=UPI0028632B43|nr:hypothetical protein [Pseudarthrobacter sulfonivorans]MDR6416067.1 hypothetical protein [Pseudarthrobacter sulfonivorans]